MPEVGRSGLVNLGCGRRFHPDWLNFDLGTENAHVRRWDLTQGIPLPDGSQDVVYSSALLEHLEPELAENLLREAWRVLKVGGLCRVGVPDTENICRLYLETLDQIRQGVPEAVWQRNWFLLELADQGYRNFSGGLMKRRIQEAAGPEKKFIETRIGNEASEKPASRRRFSFGKLWRCLQIGLIRVTGGRQAADALKIGFFRLSGESHRWLPDETSLGEMMKKAGFGQLRRHSAQSSAVPGWGSFGLDSGPDGRPHKPDLFFMEGCKI